METPQTSLKLFIMGQLSFIVSLFSPANLDVAFKILSIISVLMVILINMRKCINAVKDFFKKRRK
jgi:hypothetical protein